MKIVVAGTGYVGLVTGACLSEIGHNVTCVDIDKNKVEMMKQGISPIYEPGLDELLKRNHDENRLYFTVDYKKGLIVMNGKEIKISRPNNMVIKKL